MTDTAKATNWLPNIRAIFEFLVVSVSTIAFVFTALGVLGSMLSPNSAGSHDFVEYWASGHLLVNHANPYDANALLNLERSAGFPKDAHTLIMGNPPSALLITLPLGMVGAKLGEWLWLLLILGSLLGSVQLLRSMYALPKGPLRLLGFAFAPALTCLLAGQISLFMLLGLVLFLRWHNNRPFLAGMALWFCLLKPHMFLPFGAVLLVWIVRSRCYPMLTGITTALGLRSATATALDPRVWTEYFEMMAKQRLDRLVLPCVSSALRQLVYPHTTWVQSVPAALGCLWALAYFFKHRNSWNWIERASVLTLVSVTVAPYAWFFDQAILVPAILEGSNTTRSRTLIAILALMSAGIEIASLRGVLLLSPFYLWTAPAWLLWFLFATRGKASKTSVKTPVLSSDTVTP
jgi:hypothetical protein